MTIVYWATPIAALLLSITVPFVRWRKLVKDHPEPDWGCQIYRWRQWKSRVDEIGEKHYVSDFAWFLVTMLSCGVLLYLLARIS